MNLARREDLIRVGLVGLGGVLGTFLRYGLESLWPTHPARVVLTMNLSGSLAIGALGVLFLELGILSSRGRLFWGVGVLGGYTTFSTFALILVQDVLYGPFWRAILYLLLTFGGGLLGTEMGAAAARLAHRSRANRASERPETTQERLLVPCSQDSDEGNGEGLAGPAPSDRSGTKDRA